jgi:hypothetical protein
LRLLPEATFCIDGVEAAKRRVGWAEPAFHDLHVLARLRATEDWVELPDPRPTTGVLVACLLRHPGQIVGAHNDALTRASPAAMASAAVCVVVELGSLGRGISRDRAACCAGRLLFRQLLLAALTKRGLSRPFGRRLLSPRTRPHRASFRQRRCVHVRPHSVRFQTVAGLVSRPKPRAE